MAALALIGVRIADAHVHLCFDGHEPRSSLEFSESAPICHNGDGAHNDQDVDAVGAALAKKDVSYDEAMPLLVASFILLLVPPERGTLSEVATQNPSPQHPYLFLPLLRGPPV